MLCKTCWSMLRRQKNKQWRGTFDLSSTHHTTLDDLQTSKKDGCGICCVLFEELESRQGGLLNQAEDDKLDIQASLSIPMPRENHLYRLEFKLRYKKLQCQRTFALIEAVSTDPPFKTPTSSSTSSDEVFQRALEWMKRCQCFAEVGPQWYPARLISLERLKKRDFFYTETLEASNNHADAEVELIERSGLEAAPPPKHTRYVTLSYCWGSIAKENERAKLLAENIEDFKRGISLRTLPRTLRHAIIFAAQIPDVGYIWIDSLCIIQENEADWLQQSACMDSVYSHAFLNLSATAAANSDEGFFFDRKPESLFENEILLNIAGIPGATTNEGSQGRDLRRCTILDLSFWKDRVDDAPVNKRGWVLQERLMAPRVLHFCRDQVAWECCEFEAAEGHPEGIPNYQPTLHGISVGSRLKGLDANRDGAWLRSMRLQGYDDPDPHLQSGVNALELWGRIVEVYSKTKVTQPGDKLIALSGMARWMSKKIEETPKAAIVRRDESAEISQHALPKSSQYVAGLWALHLASQLLWYVEPTFRYGSFEHLTESPPGYRAPSFSWAAIDADRGNGIKYGEVTDRDLLITVEGISITPRSRSDEFGILDDAYVELQVKLREASFSRRPPDRFAWHLLGRGNLNDEIYTDVYLDCPARDATGDNNGGILSGDVNMFVVPAAYTDRKASRESKYLTCLILRLDRTHPAKPVFRRVGLTKLSPYGDHKALDNHEILKPYDSDANMVENVPYDKMTGMHRIRLI